jgi:hypothetical protein
MPIRAIKAATPSAASDANTSMIDPPPRRRSAVAKPRHTPAPEPRSPNWDADGNYIVGKGKPPVKSRFKKGQSGNPKGRPKSAKGVNTLVREVLGAKLPVRTAQGEKHMNAVEFALNKLREQAAKGNIRAILAVLQHWMQAVPDNVPEAANPAGPALTAADQQILDSILAVLDLGVAEDGIVRELPYTEGATL